MARMVPFKHHYRLGLMLLKTQHSLAYTHKHCHHPGTYALAHVRGANMSFVCNIRIYAVFGERTMVKLTPYVLRIGSARTIYAHRT